jgi:hypothetical protein
LRNEKTWESVKGTLEEGFEYVYGIKVSLSSLEIFEGLLFGFMNECGKHHFPFQFDNEAIDMMVKRVSTY